MSLFKILFFTIAQLKNSHPHCSLIPNIIFGMRETTHSICYWFLQVVTLAAFVRHFHPRFGSIKYNPLLIYTGSVSTGHSTNPMVSCASRSTDWSTHVPHSLDINSNTPFDTSCVILQVPIFWLQSRISTTSTFWLRTPLPLRPIPGKKREANIKYYLSDEV